MHKGTYADDCLVNRVTQVRMHRNLCIITIASSFQYQMSQLPPLLQHKCYIVATCDRDLKRRLRKIPGVPIMYVSQHRYTVEQMPDDSGGTCAVLRQCYRQLITCSPSFSVAPRS